MYDNLQQIDCFSQNNAFSSCRNAMIERENEMLKEQVSLMKERITELEKDKARNLTDSAKIENEMKIIAKFNNFDLKESLHEFEEMDVVIPSSHFSSIASKVKEQCPIISNLLETLAIGQHTSRNCGKKSADNKFKCALQMLCAVNEIHSQKSDSDISTLFGLLLIANGAGKAIIQFLHPFGLTKSYSF